MQILERRKNVDHSRSIWKEKKERKYSQRYRNSGNIQKQYSTCSTDTQFYLIEKSTFKLTRTYLVTFIFCKNFLHVFRELIHKLGRSRNLSLIQLKFRKRKNCIANYGVKIDYNLRAECSNLSNIFRNLS